MAIRILLVVVMLLPTTVQAQRAEYCTGPGYLAYEIARPRSNSIHDLFVFGVRDSIHADTVAFDNPKSTVHGILCRDSTILVAYFDSVVTVHLDTTGRPTRRETLPLTIRGRIPGEYYRETRVFNEFDGTPEVRSPERERLATRANGTEVWLDIVDRVLAAASCRIERSASLIERTPDHDTLSRRVVFSDTARRDTGTKCTASGLHGAADRRRADSIGNALAERIERAHGLDSPAAANALGDSVRVVRRRGDRELAFRLADRAVAITEGRPGIDLATRIYGLRTWGLTWPDVNNTSILDKALEMERAAGFDPKVIDTTLRELAEAYRVTWRPEKAAEIIRSITPDSVVRALSPMAGIERLTVFAESHLKRREYDSVQMRRAEAQALVDSARLPPAAMERILETSAEAYERVAAADERWTTYQRLLQIERAKPKYDPAIPVMLMSLAAVQVDRGNLRAADSLYRETFREAAAHPGTRPWDACRYWSALLRDLGRVTEAAALDQFDCVSSRQPPPIPARRPVPEHVDVIGRSPSQLTRALYMSGGPDMAVVWKEYGLPPLTAECDVCRLMRADLPGVGNGAVVDISDNGDSRRSFGAHHLLIEPVRSANGNVREWRVTAYIDSASIGWRGAAPDIERAGTERWLVLSALIEENSGADEPTEPTYRSHRVTWYDLRNRVARPALEYSLSGYETAWQLSARLGQNFGPGAPRPVAPGRRTTVKLLPLHIEGGEPVIELDLHVTLRAATGYTRASERDLFTLTHHMTLVRRKGATEFTADSARSDLPLRDMALLYDIPSTKLTYDDVVRLAFAKLKSIASGGSARDKEWVRRLATQATDSERKRALLGR